MNDKEIEEIMLGMVHEKAKQLYSEKVISYGVHPKNYGNIDKPDGCATVTNDCGETLEIFLKIRSGKVEEARFTTDGCLFTIAAGSAVAAMAKGKTLRECLQINQSSIMAFLEGMPKEHVHCAFHAALTLHRALRDYAIASRRSIRKPHLPNTMIP
jgi:nitrogen fixation protein NifU and related proteins